jgi:hypothetical protein
MRPKVARRYRNSALLLLGNAFELERVSWQLPALLVSGHQEERTFDGVRRPR